jgi:hypothetical protein
MQTDLARSHYLAKDTIAFPPSTTPQTKLAKVLVLVLVQPGHVLNPASPHREPESTPFRAFQDRFKSS